MRELIAAIFAIALSVFLGNLGILLVIWVIGRF